MKKRRIVHAVLGILILGGCSVMPKGPSVIALPGSGSDFEHFRADDLYCRNFALHQVGGQSPGEAATESAVTGAVVGAGVGAAAGAAFGGGQGAAIGAGSGLLAGTLFGSAAANQSYYGTQYSYDANYVQCMYAKGHRVPVYGNFTQDFYQSNDYDARGPYNIPANRPNANIPPPPPGQPPPPPPGVLIPQ